MWVNAELQSRYEERVTVSFHPNQVKNVQTWQEQGRMYFRISGANYAMTKFMRSSRSGRVLAIELQACQTQRYPLVLVGMGQPGAALVSVFEGEVAATTKAMFKRGQLL